MHDGGCNAFLASQVYENKVGYHCKVLSTQDSRLEAPIFISIVV